MAAVQFGSNLLGWSSASLGASSSSGPMNIKDIVGFAQYIKWSGGTAAGSFKIQVSCDPGTPTNWEDLAGSTVVVAGAGSQMWNISNTFFGWYRIVFTRTGGTGTLDVSCFNAKGH